MRIIDFQKYLQDSMVYGFLKLKLKIKQKTFL